MSANPLLVSSPCRCVRKIIKGTLDRYYILLIVLNYILKATQKVNSHTSDAHTRAKILSAVPTECTLSKRGPKLEHCRPPAAVETRDSSVLENRQLKSFPKITAVITIKQDKIKYLHYIKADGSLLGNPEE